MLHGITLPAGFDTHRPLRNRDLDPTMGRWTRQDPIGYADGPNIYEYERSLPLSYTDASGTISAATVWRGLLAAIERWQLESAAASWNSTSPQWSLGNQCAEQSGSLSVFLQKMFPKYWHPTFDGGRSGLLFHHVTVLVPINGNPLPAEVLDPYKYPFAYPFPRGGYPVKIKTPGEFRSEYPDDCGDAACKPHALPLGVPTPPVVPKPPRVVQKPLPPRFVPTPQQLGIGPDDTNGDYGSPGANYDD